MTSLPTPRRTAFLYSDDLLRYDLGGKHPLKQVRLQMVHRLLGAYGMFAPEGPVEWAAPVPATEEEILKVHTRGYVEAVHRAGRGDAGGRGLSLDRYGLGPGDTPAFPGIYEASALYTGGTAEAARMVLSGRYDVAFNVSGGLHHAHADRASGFCTFNDLAMGIHTLLEGGCERVAYIDIDVHHGDGVQGLFYEDPRVLTISLHESGRYLFPGTGFPYEIGEGAAEGTSVNLPFYPYTEDAVWHEGFDAVVPTALARFQPDAYVLQVGADAHWEDPLAHLMLTSRGWMAAIEKLLVLAEGKPIVLTGGGGYNIRTVARLWTMVTALCAGVRLPDRTPPAYDAMYGISYLHDTDAPEVEEKVRQACVEYAAEQIAELTALGVI
jgi:acetoin utilization protein AcuC